MTEINTSVQSHLARGHIAVLSTLMMANASICRVHWADIFASGRYVNWTVHVPFKSAPSHGKSGPLSNTLFFGPGPTCISPPKWHLDRFSHFCPAHQCAQQIHQQTHDHTTSSTCNIGNRLATGCTYVLCASCVA